MTELEPFAVASANLLLTSSIARLRARWSTLRSVATAFNCATTVEGKQPYSNKSAAAGAAATKAEATGAGGAIVGRDAPRPCTIKSMSEPIELELLS
jgi:hypothetical protein